MAMLSHAILAFALALLAGSIGIGVTYYLTKHAKRRHHD